MSVKQRLARAERAAGIGEKPETIIFVTYYENEDGTSDFHDAWAVINRGGKQVDGLSSEDGETLKEFKDRLGRRIRELTGR